MNSDVDRATRTDRAGRCPRTIGCVDNQVVEFRVWRVPTDKVPSAILHMARDRGPLRRTPGVTFQKLLGTGSGQSFTLRDADLHHWALLTVFDTQSDADRFADNELLQGWQRICAESLTVRMTPLSSRGRWAGREPFELQQPARWRGPVAALTRGRVKASQWRAFWQAVPPVALDLNRRAGLLMSIGIGEAPVGLQGTFSLWESGQDLSAFAHRGPAHQQVISQTRERDWYAEELFARFAVQRVSGTFHGRPIPGHTATGGADAGDGSAP